MSNAVNALVQTPTECVLSSRQVHSGVRELELHLPIVANVHSFRVFLLLNRSATKSLCGHLSA